MGNRLSGKQDKDDHGKGSARMSATGRPSAAGRGGSAGGAERTRGREAAGRDAGQRRRLREAKKPGGPGRTRTAAPEGAEPGRRRAVTGASASPSASLSGRGRTVLAAGAVLWLPGRQKKKGLGRPRIALIHRPKYDDWSLPKGKLDPGESLVQAALREVEEETGLRCVLGAELPAQHYLAQGRPKEVRYWAAVPVGGSFTPNREVDRLEWLPARKARARLTHDRDRVLVDALLAALGARPLSKD
ncbi:hypothetical protein GCM10018781_58000 [Kitasatospora indigofera]|uniref:Nudix hydrolase domain-containing protein n=1 Tax=Kitasatospora indigofera TaxID=67307 RepID=A0A919G7T7_9ACTN|nr:hypothetical protein GCM10018781_58000 [Kitasatospora indigofera]